MSEPTYVVSKLVPHTASDALQAFGYDVLGRGSYILVPASAIRTLQREGVQFRV